MTICKNAKVNYWTADMDLCSMKPMPYIPDDNDNDDDDDDNEMITTPNRDNDDEQLDDIIEQQRIKLERKQKYLDEYLVKNPMKEDMVIFKRMNKYYLIKTK